MGYWKKISNIFSVFSRPSGNKDTVMDDNHERQMQEAFAAAEQMYQAGDYAAAFRQMAAVAQAGDAQGQYNLAVFYRDGSGTARDEAKARFWLERAAAQDFAPAQYELGVFCYQGEGGAQDMAQARTWFERAAALGHADAQRVLNRWRGR